MFLHSVPNEPNKRNEWISAIGTYQEFDYYVSKFHVCELHFPEGSIRKIGKRTTLQADALPTIFPTV